MSVSSVNASVVMNAPLSDALNCAREIVSLAAQRKANPTAVSMTDISDRVNALLTRILSDFPASDESLEIAEIFKSKASGCFADADYANVRADLIPLKLLRELMSAHKVGFRIRDVPSFKAFTARYRPALFSMPSQHEVHGVWAPRKSDTRLRVGT
jgi:hypothetical protein